MGEGPGWGCLCRVLRGQASWKRKAPATGAGWGPAVLPLLAGQGSVPRAVPHVALTVWLVSLPRHPWMWVSALGLSSMLTLSCWPLCLASGLPCTEAVCAPVSLSAGRTRALGWVVGGLPGSLRDQPRTRLACLLQGWGAGRLWGPLPGRVASVLCFSSGRHGALLHRHLLLRGGDQDRGPGLRVPQGLLPAQRLERHGLRGRPHGVGGQPGGAPAWGRDLGCSVPHRAGGGAGGRVQGHLWDPRVLRAAALHLSREMGPHTPQRPTGSGESAWGALGWGCRQSTLLFLPEPPSPLGLRVPICLMGALGPRPASRPSRLRAGAQLLALGGWGVG